MNLSALAASPKSGRLEGILLVALLSLLLAAQIGSLYIHWSQQRVPLYSCFYDFPSPALGKWFPKDDELIGMAIETGKRHGFQLARNDVDIGRTDSRFRLTVATASEDALPAFFTEYGSRVRDRMADNWRAKARKCVPASGCGSAIQPCMESAGNVVGPSSVVLQMAGWARLPQSWISPLDGVTLIVLLAVILVSMPGRRPREPQTRR